MLSWQDVPNALSKREVFALQTYASGKLVLELGSLLGASTIALAQTAALVTAVDKHTGYGTPTLHRFMSNMDRAGVSAKVQPVLLDVKDLVLSIMPDFVFIDLDGSEELTTIALDKVREVPIVAIHDVDRSRCGVTQAVVKSRRQQLGQVDTLVLLGPGR